MGKPETEEICNCHIDDDTGDMNYCEKHEPKLTLLERASIFAIRCHKGQFRWDGVTPYITHPIAVSEKFKDEKFKAVALLHDVIEDCNVGYSDLIKVGIPEDVAEAVLALTRAQGQDYLEYILALKSNEMARQVKIADINHNLLTVPIGKQAKYKLARYILEHVCPGGLHG